MKNKLLNPSGMGIWLVIFSMIVSLQSCINSGPPTDLTKEVLLPKPVSITATAKSFPLSNTTVIFVEDGNEEVNNIATNLSAELNAATGFVNKVESTTGTPPALGIYLALSGQDTPLGNEGYELTITEELVTIKANQPAGLFYGVHTLLQLVPLISEEAKAKAETNKLNIATGTIRDYPTYSWRGSMLDVARHFFSVEDVKRYIDLIAAYKMNDLVEFGESMIALAKADNEDKRLKFTKEIRDKGEKLLRRLNGQ